MNDRAKEASAAGEYEKAAFYEAVRDELVRRHEE